MRPDSRNLHRLILAKGIALAAAVLGANALPAADAANAPAGHAPQSLLAPETLPSLGDVAAGPLLAMYNAPHGAAVETFEPLALFPVAPIDAEARLNSVVAVSSTPSDAATAPSPAAEPPSPPPLPGSSEGAPPDPVPTAIAEALARLIARDGLNPLGDGDWRAARAAIGAFYADRLFAPVWVDETGLTTAGRAALAQLERAPEDGLNLSSFALPRQFEGRLSPKDLAEAETTIAEAIVTYAEQASGSRITPFRVSRLVTAAPGIADPGVALAEVVSAPDPAKRLADFNPPQKGYQALREELRRLTDAGPRRGEKQAAADLEAVAQDDPPVVENDAEPPSPRLKTARRPLKGLFRNAVYAASVDHVETRRRKAILANMEMWRWEPRDMGERRIEINVPDFTVAMLDGDAIVHSARVVVGKPDTPTPIFSNVMRYVLINPSWEVPDSIIRKEMLPRLASDPNYLSRRGYVVKTVGGRLTVRQPPGEDNALGRIAFMFPNDHAVYMHDTPSQLLFDSEVRAFSHGCLRVEDPLRLAELVLGWPEERINAAIGGPERTIFLPRPVPIHIEYFTEFVDEFGELQERPDVYGLVQKVANILSSVGQD
jgi:L,D-transpeptidase YcbB